MKKILLSALPLLLMIAVSCGKNREALPENDTIEFKDPNFLKALLTYDCAYGDDTEHPICIDDDNDGKISFSEAKKVKTLVLTVLDDETAESYNIADISEIRYFTELTGLICGDNQLTSLDLGNNAELGLLNCDRNRLTSVDVSKNTALKVLSLSSNQLTSVDVSNNAALEMLHLDGNQLTSLDVSNNAGLKVLSCGRNRLVTLDLSKNTSLTDVYCAGNELKKIIIPTENSLDKYLLQSIKDEYGDDVIEYR